MGIGEIGAHPHRLVEPAKRIVGLARILQGQRQVVAQLGRRRTAGQGTTETGHGVVGPLEHAIDRAQVAVASGAGGIQLRGSLEKSNGRFGATQLHLHQAHLVPQLGGLGRGGEQLPIDAFGAIQLAGADQLPGLLQGLADCGHGRPLRFDYLEGTSWGGIAAIHCRTKSAPSRWIIRLPSSGIMIPTSVDVMRNIMIDFSGSPGTMSKSRPPLPRPAATGVLKIPYGVGCF